MSIAIPKTVMNKGELVESIAAKSSVSKKVAEEVLNAAIESIVESVASGKKVTLVGFGTFDKRSRKAREGRNPKTNEKMLIPATNVPGFAPGRLFRETVAGEKTKEEALAA